MVHMILKFCRRQYSMYSLPVRDSISMRAMRKWIVQMRRDYIPMADMSW